MAPGPQKYLGIPVLVDAVGIHARRRIADAPPSREVAVQPARQVPPDLHARQKCVRQEIEALPRKAARIVVTALLL
ncbi:unnamed protein product, partial [Musa acuminata var. zebrina]